MKIALFSLAGIAQGKHNLKDPRLDQTHKLVEADKKTYAQVDIIEEGNLDADVILTSHDAFPDLILKDLEFVETRLGRNPPEAEQALLQKISSNLEQERPVFKIGLTAAELETISAHNFLTNRPIVVAEPEDAGKVEDLLLRAFTEAGFISFLTVGGKENRAWPIRKGATAWEAAGSIHSDIQKGFIRAEVIGFEDFIAAGGETQAKRAGKQRLETKSYIIQDYDLVNFRHSK